MKLNYFIKPKHKDDFYFKLNALIEYTSKFYCPDKAIEYLPNYETPILNEKCWFRQQKRQREAWEKAFFLFDMNEAKNTYNTLADEYSKEMYLRVLVYRLFEKPGFRFPLFYSHVWNSISYYEKMICSDEKIPLNLEVPGMEQLYLYKFDLRKLNFNLTLYINILGVIINFVIEQYRYKNEVFAKEGDYIIDGGACGGDTTLYFADLVKAKGKVFAFEFVNENINFLNKNVELNPQYKNNIELIKRPLGLNSSETFYTYENGPASVISREKREGYVDEIKTISIDEFVSDQQIEKIDFIKMDIEGFELEALKGAMNTIKKFRPKLAISIYHRPQDLWEIPTFIRENFPDYNLYLDHYTIITGETILYAKVR